MKLCSQSHARSCGKLKSLYSCYHNACELATWWLRVISSSIKSHDPLITILQIPDCHFEKKNSQNDPIIFHFEYFFTCHYSKTVLLAENLNEIKITHDEKIFSHIKQNFSHFEKGLGINNIFVVSLRLPLFSPRYITLKRNQKIISKISNYLT